MLCRRGRARNADEDALSLPVLSRVGTDNIAPLLGALPAALGGQRRLLFEFDPPGMEVRVEPVAATDKSLRRNWDDRLCRIVLEYQESRTSGAVSFRFRGE